MMETSRRRRSSSSGPKVERKVIEKNRRELQKGLYSQLQSLLPPSHGFNHMNEVIMPSLPDQIDEAVKYIKSLKIKVEQMKEKKKNLLRTSTSLSRRSASSEVNNLGVSDQATTSRAQTRPSVEIQDMGPLMDIIVVSGLDRVEVFFDIIKLLHQEQGLDVANASFSLHGNSIIQIMHKMAKEISGFGGETLSRKLECFVCGSSSSSCDDNYLLELKQLPCWEFDEQIDAINIWGLQPFQFRDNNSIGFD